MFPLLKKLKVFVIIRLQEQVFWEASSPNPRDTKSRTMRVLFFFFFLHLPQNVSVSIDPTQTFVGVGMRMQAPGTCLAEPPDPDQTAETLLCLRFSSCKMSLTAHSFSSLSRRHPLHNGGLTVVFHKMPDFSFSHSPAIVYKVIAHSMPS